jgi:hypothetical protein
MLSQYDIYVTDAVLDALSPPILQFAIRSIFVVSLHKTLDFRPSFTATKQLVIKSHTGEWEVKKHPKQHLLHMYYIMIQSQLKYSIGAKVLS